LEVVLIRSQKGEKPILHYLEISQTEHDGYGRQQERVSQKAKAPLCHVD
jgi:hypothetical protein